MNPLTGLGPFFAVDTHPAGEPAEPWRPLSEVLDDGPVLRERVAQNRAVLGGDFVEPRVAASIAHLGLAARIISPALGLAVGAGAVPDYSTAWWQPKLGGAFPLSLEENPPVESDVVSAFASRVLRGPLARLDDAMAQFSLARNVRRGNVASALNGAVTVLRSERPEWTDRIARIVAALEELPELTGTGTRENGRFRRRSCCLFYRAAPDRNGPKCGDCVLI
ncbi:FhuF-like iron-sulfur protein [Amycolatopsis echigonensis]|uniref:FhuF-like iron-sulfur protein n=1 Tax=Amycolatopsis echigonensis TaxID=2576905 RepID=A0A2N3WQP6_9PSEU|nr:(2Fe-2S)-binding protein [Amycolatopsis niigatensis]PKV96173.1 FhuF-like iron-sulfur protein [Amycolatopsis niigatensis]